ncbi:TlpA family protein disulfide reductase [Maribacter sp. 2210JD10-5]|uniref:TlpA family protein disulfide reductase n=1 Tax=Maribacter sp. 2210JD10-5 TaxID=3386272 RepID=UPI0039BD9340
MKKLLFLFLILFNGLTAQHTISGNFSPAKDFKWLIAYELTPGEQRYVADTEIKEGYFKMELPAGTTKGNYRLVYAVPQDEYFIDVLYNGQEDIEFNFNWEEGVQFIKSDENILLNNYFAKINEIEKEILAIYQTENTSKTDFLRLTKKLAETQTKMEALQTNSLAHQFITANKPYIPKTYEPVEQYLSNKRETYFDHLDFDNPLLQGSTYLSDKIINYPFSTLSPDITSQSEMESELYGSIAMVGEKIKTMPEAFKIDVFYQLWKSTNGVKLNNVSDYIFTNHLKNLALKAGKHEMVAEIENTNRLRLGEKSPDITWKDGDVTKTLSDLRGAKNYILIFWSSTCSHCLKELPPLHKELQKFDSIKVVAVGLEEDRSTWEKETAQFPFFQHAIALGKWESEYAKTFNIQKTPTYFILDKDQHFIAKPESDKEMVAYLKSE